MFTIQVTQLDSLLVQYSLSILQAITYGDIVPIWNCVSFECDITPHPCCAAHGSAPPCHQASPSRVDMTVYRLLGDSRRRTPAYTPTMATMPIAAIAAAANQPLSVMTLAPCPCSEATRRHNQYSSLHTC